MRLLKDTKLYSIFTGTCPVCHKGSMYEVSNPLKLRTVLKMQDHCSHCNLKFKIEPSFFFGAMYVSYAVGVAIAVAAFIISFFILGLNEHYTFFVIILSQVVTFPWVLRISRNIWINFFLDYDRNLNRQEKLNQID